jgi:hypothetical protein
MYSGFYIKVSKAQEFYWMLLRHLPSWPVKR